MTPRFGGNILGGAENLCYGLAKVLQECDHQVDIFTSCSDDHYTWKSIHKPGIAEEEGIIVHRFEVLAPKDGWVELQMKLISQDNLSAEDQYSWLEKGVHSPALYRSIRQHCSEYDVIVFLPYLISFIQYALWSALDDLNHTKKILIPCLHHESYAYMQWVSLSMEKVDAVLFNTPEERDLAIKLLSIKPANHAVLGSGITTTKNHVQKKPVPKLQLIYIGRLEEGKNVKLLYDYMKKYYDQNQKSFGRIKLVVAGSGPDIPPDHPAFEYYGPITEQEKIQLCASSLALCQPSLNESFSIVIMESWLQKTPVLVHGNCSVTRGHIQRSKGGLWFDSYEQFSHVVDYLISNSNIANEMGENGFQYVTKNYTWSNVARRFESYIDYWFGN